MKPPIVTLWPWQKKRLPISAEHVIKARPETKGGWGVLPWGACPESSGMNGI